MCVRGLTHTHTPGASGTKYVASRSTAVETRPLRWPVSRRVIGSGSGPASAMRRAITGRISGMIGISVPPPQFFGLGQGQRIRGAAEAVVQRLGLLVPTRLSLLPHSAGAARLTASGPFRVYGFVRGTGLQTGA